MDLQLEGKTALVTGPSAGIGRAIATGLAAEGVQTAIVARRLDLLESLAAEIADGGLKRPEIIVRSNWNCRLRRMLHHRLLLGIGIARGCDSSQPFRRQMSRELPRRHA